MKSPHLVSANHEASLRLKLGVMMTRAWCFTATQAWILLGVLVVLGNDDAINCRFLLFCVCMLFLGIPVPSRQHRTPAIPQQQQRASKMDKAPRQMLQSFPIEDISLFSSDDESYSPADEQSSSSSSKWCSLPVNNASDADAFAQVNARLENTKSLPDFFQKQSLLSTAPITASIPVGSLEPSSPLKWNTRLADRATAQGEYFLYLLACYAVDQ
jgi:hypothetical protein